MTPKVIANIAAFRCVSYNGYDWSSDGQSIWVAVCDDYADQALGKYAAADKNDGIYRVSLDGQTTIRLCKIGLVRRIKRSPDDKYLACEVGGVQSECLHFPAKVVIVSTRTGDVTEIGKVPPRLSFSWSADSQTLCFDAQDGPSVYNISTKHLDVLPRAVEPLWWVSPHPKTREVYATGQTTIFTLRGRQWTPVWKIAAPNGG